MAKEREMRRERTVLSGAAAAAAGGGAPATGTSLEFPAAVGPEAPPLCATS